MTGNGRASSGNDPGLWFEGCEGWVSSVPFPICLEITTLFLFLQWLSWICLFNKVSVGPNQDLYSLRTDKGLRMLQNRTPHFSYSCQCWRGLSRNIPGLLLPRDVLVRASSLRIL